MMTIRRIRSRIWSVICVSGLSAHLLLFTCLFLSQYSYFGWYSSVVYLEIEYVMLLTVRFSWCGRKTKEEKDKGLYYGHKWAAEECKVPLKQTKEQSGFY